MDFIIAVVLGFALMIYGIIGGGGNIMESFVDIPSIIITVGGTFAGILAAFPLSVLKNVPSHMKIIMGKSKYDPLTYIDTIIELAGDARKSGLLILEEKAAALDDPFFKNGIMLIVDAIEEEKVRQILEGDLNYLSARHQEGASIYAKGAAFAPAFGMIGTLIGLVNMLASMDMDSASGASGITSGMAIALLTTLYGSILANLIFAPLANKLSIKSSEEILCKEIIIEGIISIQSGENPKLIREKLTSSLQQRLREKDVEGEDGAPKKEKKGKKKKQD